MKMGGSGKYLAYKTETYEDLTFYSGFEDNKIDSDLRLFYQGEYF